MISVQFTNMQTGKKEYREYPKVAQFSNNESLCIFLQNRNFLKGDNGWIVDKIEDYNPIKSKNELADKIGQLIYF